ncbi:EamA family transporter RarD [Pseudogulbenkiania sp. MAI-1]|uniref:EamA family transporter RarD n=1 Tax=Pseudogulbenkiania sp. MAI-1 TaxID=990370 RepID=UPI00045E7CFD|nr:EamA family transporter RarD [Pseudogulbenkiania sp. MAI-1]
MPHSQPLSGKGVMLSVLASVLFALLSGYTTLLKPLDGLAIYAWRVLWTLPGVLLLVAVRGQWSSLRGQLARLRSEPALWLALPAMAALLATQLWLFMWAPLHGQAMAVSMGYFLLPLTMVLTGCLLYGERLYRLQWLAVACAMLGVAHELWLTRAFAWPTLLVAIGYPPYFVLRRWSKLEPVSGFVLELAAMSPVALVLLWQLGEAGWGVLAEPRFWLLLPGLGLISTVALVCYLVAGRLLPLGLLGILGYVEPVLLFVLAVTLLGEPLSADSLLTYGPIWLAVLLTGVHTLLHQRGSLRAA